MILSAAAKSATASSAPAIPLASSPSNSGPASPEADAHFRLGYRRWLDGLRGVAILLVFGCHLGPLPGGFLGVDLFFVLSGFLITSLLLEEWQNNGFIRLKRFYLRRALRLLPAFFVVLVLCSLSIAWLPSARERWARCREIVVAASYISNWPMLHKTPLPILGHTWSLAVEEQFYLLWPTLLYGMLRLRMSRQRIILLVCGGIATSALLRLGLYRWHVKHGTDHLIMIFRLYRGLDTRADALLAGCLLGLLVGWDLLPKTRLFVRWTGAASVIWLLSLAYLARRGSTYDPLFYRGLFTLVALMTALFMARLLSAPARLACRILESSLLTFIGRISYGLYLFHMPIIYALLPWCVYLGLTVSPYLGQAAFISLTLVLSFLAAVLSFYIIERPCLRLKDRLRSQTTVNTSVTPPAESYLSSGSSHAAA